MAIRDLVRRHRGNEGPSLARWESDPFLDLWREMDRMFERFGRFNGLEAFEEGLLPSRRFGPALEVSETSDQIRVSAELPGLNKEDVEISIEGDNLILSGNKKQEEERKEGGYYRSERYYGAFRRSVPLPCDVNFDKAEATFKNGVLTVVLPKTEEEKRKHTKIEIKNG